MTDNQFHRRKIEEVANAMREVRANARGEALRQALDLARKVGKGLANNGRVKQAEGADRVACVLENLVKFEEAQS